MGIDVPVAESPVAHTLHSVDETPRPKQLSGVGAVTELRILGKCKALWGKPRTLWRLSQRSTELSCTRFDEERSKKSKAIDEQRCGTFFLHEHISPRTSSTVVRVRLSYVFDCRTSSGWRCLWGTHVGGCARTRYRVGPGLRLPMRKKENVEERLKQLYSRSQLAPS